MSIIEAFGLFMLLAGYVIGLGAVTVIDIHGLLGRHSPYWTEATTRTHKVTKPLIWIGIILAVVGGFVFYQNDDSSMIPLLQLALAVLLVINGSFLSFSVSPYMLAREKAGASAELLPKIWQFKIACSLLVSDFGWWGSLALTVAYVYFKMM